MRQATLNSYMPTTTDKEMYYRSNEYIDNYHKLWRWENKDELHARRKGRYAERKQEGMLMAKTGELEIESLSLCYVCKPYIYNEDC